MSDNFLNITTLLYISDPVTFLRPNPDLYRFFSLDSDHTFHKKLKPVKDRTIILFFFAKKYP